MNRCDRLDNNYGSVFQVEPLLPSGRISLALHLLLLLTSVFPSPQMCQQGIFSYTLKMYI